MKLFMIVAEELDLMVRAETITDAIGLWRAYYGDLPSITVPDRAFFIPDDAIGVIPWHKQGGAWQVYGD